MRPASTSSAHARAAIIEPPHPHHRGDAFGSRARGDHRPDSDVDLFIDFDPDVKVPSLLAMVGLERSLADALGVAVTITTRGSLHPLMKDAIERDAIRIQ